MPADDKKNARLIISEVILDALNDMKPVLPKLDAKRKKELQALRKRLVR